MGGVTKKRRKTEEKEEFFETRRGESTAFSSQSRRWLSFAFPASAARISSIDMIYPIANCVFYL